VEELPERRDVLPAVQDRDALVDHAAQPAHLRFFLEDAVDVALRDLRGGPLDPV